MEFQINNDLDKIKFNFHNSIHLFGALILVYFFGFWIGYGAWFLWEIFDGYKKWYYDVPDDIKHAKFPSWKWIINNTCYSDKFSLQDIFVWNLFGALIGLSIKLAFEV